ncbi:cupin-like domain-containing protein [Sphingomonas sp. AOB5]|uniref:cupin-like domain-containing protein n=1 Tax=Sphingomonas sp. AOB5 TaxID=3034017 RepID=UPI0023F6CB4A|nr:cupin-like domain-containing protein [Sphingomonas sp. AOB5]MDF7776809.1 cupin-like domain-containing protein [Sphingomonas sp. AOB5]
MTPVREISGIDATTFHEVVAGYAPVVLRGAARDWPIVAASATAQSACDYLLGFDEGAAAEAFVGPAEINGRFFYAADMKGFNFERRKGSFADLLRYLLSLQGSERPPAVYAGALETSQCLPGFAEANPMPLVDGLGATPRIWVGNASTVSTHFDASDNVAVVAAGRRRFTLFPPDQVHNLYVGPLDHNMAGQPASMVALNDPDFERYPRFREALAAAQVAELEPGDAIFIPALWWHQVDALSGFNVLVNYWWADSPDMAARFDAVVHGVLAISHLPEPRREAWRAMFDTFVFRKHGHPAEHLAEQDRRVLGEPTPGWRHYLKQYLMRGLGRP